jgi:hypothetical protein
MKETDFMEADTKVPQFEPVEPPTI